MGFNEKLWADTRRNTTQLESIASEFSTWTPTLTWTTATPTGVSTIARYKQVGKLIFVTLIISATDSKGTTAVRSTLPVAPKALNTSQFVPTRRIRNGVADVYQSTLNDDGVNNDVSCTTATTNGQSVALQMTFFYETN